jgi:hypothetical protein
VTSAIWCAQKFRTFILQVPVAACADRDVSGGHFGPPGRGHHRHFGHPCQPEHGLNKKIYAKIEAWRNRRIESEHPYLYLNGIVMKGNWAGGPQIDCEAFTMTALAEAAAKRPTPTTGST